MIELNEGDLVYLAYRRALETMPAQPRFADYVKAMKSIEDFFNQFNRLDLEHD